MEFDAADAGGVAREGREWGFLRQGPKVDVSFAAAGGEVDAAWGDGRGRESGARVPGDSAYAVGVATEDFGLFEVGDGQEFDTAAPVAGGDDIAVGGEARDADRAVAGDLGAKEGEVGEAVFEGFAVFDVRAEGDGGFEFLGCDSCFRSGQGVEGDCFSGF